MILTLSTKNKGSNIIFLIQITMIQLISSERHCKS
jgi:hypothetical protein